MSRTFGIRYSPWLRPLFTVLGLGPRFSGVAVGDDAVTVRMGLAFCASVPRSSIVRATVGRDVWWAIGVHTDFRGRWLVNGSARGVVVLDLEPRVRARSFGLPVTVRHLGVALDQPDAFLAALG